jgi:thioesterase domain-containing protein
MACVMALADPVAGANLSLPGIEELASHYIDEMERFQPDGPYFLMGHSVGGVVAYEMARQLTAKDKQVGLVAMFDSYVDLPTSFSEALLKFVVKNKRTLGRELLKFLKQGPRAMARGVVHNVRKLAVDPITTLAEELHPLQIPYCPHVDNLGPAFQLQRNYRPVPLRQNVILFQAVDYVDDESKPLGEDWRRCLPKAYVHYRYPEACWRRYGVKSLTVERLSSGCNHMTIVLKPHAQILAVKLRRAMDAVLGPTLD